MKSTLMDYQLDSILAISVRPCSEYENRLLTENYLKYQCAITLHIVHLDFVQLFCNAHLLYNFSMMWGAVQWILCQNTQAIFYDVLQTQEMLSVFMWAEHVVVIAQSHFAAVTNTIYTHKLCPINLYYQPSATY